MVILYFILYIFYILTITFYQDQQYIILARGETFPKDDVLTSKHVVANHM